MSHDTITTPARVRWARLRFAIIGPLLSAPAEAGDLAPRLEELAARTWRHPSNGDTIRFSAKSIAEATHLITTINRYRLALCASDVLPT